VSATIGSCKRNIFLAFLAIFSLPFCAPAFANEYGYMRLAIKGANVNLRPQPRAAGSVIARMSDGDVFFAEKWPIKNDEDGSEWYKIVLPATDSGKIKSLCDWDKLFKTNAAFVSAKYAAASPLKSGDMEHILKTPVGAGYSFDLDPHRGEFGAMIEAGLIPFQPIECEIKKRTLVFDGKPENGGTEIGEYQTGESVRIIGTDSEGLYCRVMDPNFRRSIGFVEAENIAVKRYGDGFDWPGLQLSFAMSVGANLPEIVRKWGDTKIERVAINFLDQFAIWTKFEQADGFAVSFYEFPPELDVLTDSLAVTYLQTLFVGRNGAAVGGIVIGRDDKDSVKHLLGAPDMEDEDATGEFWRWDSEFNDLVVRFGKNWLVSSVMFEARATD
jgi:hypothetical protein